MAAVRAVLIAIIVLCMAVTPLVAPSFGGSSSDDATAYAAFAGGMKTKDPVVSPMQDNDNNDNDDDDDVYENKNTILPARAERYSTGSACGAV